MINGIKNGVKNAAGAVDQAAQMAALFEQGKAIVAELQGFAQGEGPELIVRALKGLLVKTVLEELKAKEPSEIYIAAMQKKGHTREQAVEFRNYVYAGDVLE